MARTSGRAALVFLLACVLYLNTLGNGFHYDDFHSIVDNPHLRSLENLPAFFIDPRLFSVEPQNAMYRPILLVSYAFNYAFGGERPAGYHLVNVVLHGVNAALVLALMLALGHHRSLALTSAVLFAVNPLNAESVNYVSSRSELLMAFFFLAAVVAYVRFSRTGNRRWYAVAVVAALLALLSKSVAVVLVGVLALCDWYRQDRQVWRHRWKYYLPFVGMDLLYLLFARQLVGKALLMPVRPLAVQVWTQVKASVYYIFLAGMPVNLSVEHQFFVSRHPGEGPVVGAVLVLLSLAFLLCRSGKLLRFSCIWSAALLVPTAAMPLIVLVNEHRLYLAGVGLSLFLAWGWCQVPDRHRKVAWGLIAAYAAMLAVFGFQRNQAWADELVLWQDAAAKGPLMLKPHLRRGDALARLERWAEAEEAYLQAVALRPQHPGARNNLGRLYMIQGRLEAAEREFRTLLQVSPDSVPARLNLASVLMRQGNWEGAAAEYRQVLEFDHTKGVAQGRLGDMALRQGNFQRALDYYDQALGLAAERAPLLGARGVALKGLQQYEAAEISYREALQLDSALVDTWYNLGNLYMETGRRPEAVEAYERVVEIGTDATLSSRAAARLKNLRP